MMHVPDLPTEHAIAAHRHPGVALATPGRHPLPATTGRGKITPRARRNVAGVLATFGLIVMTATAAVAVDPGERLDDPALEARARNLSAELRCLVCQNQSIDDSNAPLAKDLRLLVREQIKAGKSDADVMRFVVARYGDFVLLRPPFAINTLLLWLAPLLLLAGAGYAIARSRATSLSVPEAPPLSPDEQRRLADLLDRKD